MVITPTFRRDLRVYRRHLPVPNSCLLAAHGMYGAINVLGQSEKSHIHMADLTLLLTPKPTFELCPSLRICLKHPLLRFALGARLHSLFRIVTVSSVLPDSCSVKSSYCVSTSV